jgi:hypothetical protein
MIVMDRDGSLVCNNPGSLPAGAATGTIEVPGDLALAQSDLIERVLAFAFDVLGLRALELRIREEPADAGRPLLPPPPAAILRQVIQHNAPEWVEV